MSMGYAVPLEDRAVIALNGEDSRSFLQGLITNDVEAVSPDRAVYAALLTPQGKYLFDFFLFELGGRLHLDCERARAGDLVKRLSMYKLRADVALEDTGGRYRVFALLGEDEAAALGLPTQEGAAAPFGGGTAFLDPRTASMGARLYTPEEEAATLPDGFALAGREAYEERRVALGIAEGGNELAQGRGLPLEAGLDDLHAISFDKGCYVGQEVTARMKSRGLVRNRLVPVRIEGTAPEPGAKLQLGDKEAGEIRTVCDGAGIAMLKIEELERSLAEARPLTAGEARITPGKPRWARF